MILRLLLSITSVLRSTFTENAVQKIDLFIMNVLWLCILTERNSRMRCTKRENVTRLMTLSYHKGSLLFLFLY